ncbi:MAG: hypothetical protein ACLQRH_22230 [Acidimicrobiales bacterium]
MSAAVSRTTSPAGVDHVKVNMPSAPALETAAASSGTADIGAWTMGCSIPSSSHTAVRTTTTYPSLQLQAGNQRSCGPSGQRRQLHIEL